MSPESVLTALEPRWSALSVHHARREAYYEGAQRLAAMGLALPPEMQKLQTVVNWPRVVVDAIAERQRVEGFRLAGEYQASERMWELWQRNNLDEEATPVHTEAMVQGRAWVTVDHNPDAPEYPVIMGESASMIAVDRDPRTRAITAALRRWEETSPAGDTVEMATVYLPDTTTYYARNSGRWEEYEQWQHALGVVPVVPMVNRSRLPSRHDRLAWWGSSEMADVIPLTDAACRVLTNLQGAQELLAVPVRFVFGAQESDFVDQATGRPLTTWEAYLGRMNALADPDAKVQQLPAADLNNFTAVMQSYAKLVSSVSGVPLRFFGVSSDANPASADAIRSDESRLVMRTNQRNTAFGGAWETAMRIALRMAGDDSIDADTRLETVWANPETPTFASKASALAQLWQVGLPVPRSYAYDVLGFTPEQRAEADGQASADPLTQLLTQGTGNAAGGIGSRNEPGGSTTRGGSDRASVADGGANAQPA